MIFASYMCSIESCSFYVLYFSLISCIPASEAHVLACHPVTWLYTPRSGHLASTSYV